MFERSARTVSQRSGFLISADGFLLTNHHLVEGNKAGGISIMLQDERRFPARIVVTDELGSLFSHWVLSMICLVRLHLVLSADRIDLILPILPFTKTIFKLNAELHPGSSRGTIGGHRWASH